ncbi:MAG: hypothetical protein NWR03_12315 [Akkermansiaceae bacterium]|jgi:hypothetical protein|nr:hypothetical protein [Akkermansiaceae bacterium]
MQIRYRDNFSPQSQGEKLPGFALVVCLSLMVLLLVIALGMLSLGTVALRKSGKEKEMAMARANAQVAMMVALSELQKAAGPDQRITATASILGSGSDGYGASAAPVDGRRHWTGVWKSDTVAVPPRSDASFDPTNPASRVFSGWLVSSPDPSGKELAEAATAPGGDDVTIFKGADDASDVLVPKVEVTGGQSGYSQYYAYWVEDQGVKADLGWSETEFPSDERTQASRLSSLPGVDHGVFEGPFDGEVSYPLEEADSVWLRNFSKTISVADVPLVMDSGSSEQDWLQEKRHDITLASRGLMVDVKLGGLRRDLSLAFEMDGDADMSASSQPTQFNEQIGEFVGGSDPLAAPATGQSMPVPERYLYRVVQGADAPYSDAIFRADDVIRGPNWWAVRDYANLYKRLRGTNGNYTMDARGYYPNYSASSSRNTTATSQFGINTSATAWSSEYNRDSEYIYRPARANYAPVLLGSVALFSAKVVDSNGIQGNLALGVDPFFYIWNPYNRTINVSKYAVRLSRGFGGHIQFNVTDATGGNKRVIGPARLDHYVKKGLSSGTASGNYMTYLVNNLVMQPGEVVIVSPGSGTDSSRTIFNDEATRGTNMNNSSGLLTDVMPLVANAPTATNPDAQVIQWGKFTMDLSDRVECIYTNLYYGTYSTESANSIRGFEHFWLDTYLPGASATAGNLRTDSQLGEHLQQIGGNMAGYLAIPERYEPPRSKTLPADWVWPFFFGSEAVNTKRFFGVNGYLAKPADFAESNPDAILNPREIFTQFNPAHLCTPTELWRPCALNDTYSSISKPSSDPDTLTTSLGINFPAANGKGFWGKSYQSGTSTFPLADIPSSPIHSLADFSNANLSIRSCEPFKAVGNSWASIFVPRNSLYARVGGESTRATASDSSWLINDALFDRYYLSGFAPDFTINSSGYNATGSISETLENFFSDDSDSAYANPALEAYLPRGADKDDVIGILNQPDGYMKTGAFSMIKGAFNVNSTSTAAWAALLRSNRSLAIEYAQGGGTDNSDGTPFPLGASPIDPASGAAQHWAGFSRLSDDDIWDGKGTAETSDDTGLAAEIVAQVKLRGPFMSLSDFVNRRISSSATVTNDMGALQAAIEAVGFNDDVRSSAGGVIAEYPTVNGYNGEPYFREGSVSAKRNTATGIPGDITQADILRPLAPRLTARSDTFLIRSYGEVRSEDGTRILAKAVCEAVVQRVPEYFDAETDGDNNEPWDEASNPFSPTASELNDLNQEFGRRFEVVSFRWLSQDEI